MSKRGVARRGASAGVAVLALIVCLAAGATPASARHRPGCSRRCRQLGGAGSGPGHPAPKMALLRHRVDRHRRFVNLRLRCLREHHACGGVIKLVARDPNAPELSRVDLYVPAGKTWTIEVTLSHAGLAYLKAHQRVRAFLFLQYPDQIDSFRMTIVG